MRFPKISKKVKIGLIAILTVISLILIFNQPIKSGLIHSFRPEISAQSMEKNKNAKATYDFGQVKKLTMSNVAAARANAKDLKIIGVISIPADDITLPISKGITNRNLALSAGTFRPDMKMGEGNYALAGHNMANLGSKVLFSPLYYKGKVGQMVYIMNLKRVYVYKITQKQIISKYATQVVANTPNQRILTLITCDETGAQRLMVRGQYVKTMDYHQAPASVRKALSQKYNVK